MNGQHVGAVPDLGGRGMSVRAWAVIAIPAIQVARKSVGPLEGDYCVSVVDIANQTGLLIPCSHAGLVSIRDKINALLKEGE